MARTAAKSRGVGGARHTVAALYERRTAVADRRYNVESWRGVMRWLAGRSPEFLLRLAAAADCADEAEGLSTKNRRS
jgi:hypothetical protein